ncbi:MAG TPA: ATP-binding cassette domain-containing protein [Pirellulales bacterium]|nr:ATP-binding cassette domain-containing protein [Pirellulales bacterium]
MSTPTPDSPAADTAFAEEGVVLDVRDVSKRFRTRRQTVEALAGVSLRVRKGQITGLIGPDGAGKTTLMRLAAGLLLPDEGEVFALGLNVVEDALEVQAGVGYMPQRFGLYEDLTVQENLDLYADLQGVPHAERGGRYEQLMHMTGLAPFTERLAGQLSGGMKQKLGLACALVRPPALLLLDEPTVGVDPVSRRELWRIVDGFVRDRGAGVLLSTAYLDEAERCHDVVLLDGGKLIAQGSPQDFSRAIEGRSFRVSAPGLKTRELESRLSNRAGVTDAVVSGDAVRLVLDAGANAKLEPPIADIEGASAEPVPPRFEDSFVARLREHRAAPSAAPSEPQTASSVAARHASRKGPMIDVHGLQRKFGDFYAVKGVSFEVSQGEVFGLLGANGAGKTTTFRMLCGLLPPSAGELHVAGVDLRRAPAAARARIGYMSQKFSLYGSLSVEQNLRFFASSYGLAGRRRSERIAWALEEFGLDAAAAADSASLPLGFKQRLALACALMHEPDILFLDEPTSGVDPLARREFWRQINFVAAAGVTVLVTTHFMEEVEYCDRAAIMAAGEILALGAPREIKQQAVTAEHPHPTMEDAFIRLIESREEPARRSQPQELHSPGGTGALARQPASPGGTGALARQPGTGARPRQPGEGARPSMPKTIEGHAPWNLGAGKPRRAGAAMRLRGLVRKEFLQIVRDPSSLAIAFVLPIMLLLVFGYGVSLDAEHVPIALVIDRFDADTASLAGAFAGSRYFRAVRAHGMHAAEQALLQGEVDGIVHVREDFAERLRRPQGAPIQVIVNGMDANNSRMISGYVQGVWGRWLAAWARDRSLAVVVPVELEQRVWFNANLHSRHFIVPGLIALIMTLIGALLTALVVSREWERGTMEALLVTPVGIHEVIFGKTLPYYLLGMGGMLLSLFMAVWLFGVPMRGSLWVLFGTSSLFLLTALGMGLLISTAAKSQFVAAQVAIIVTYLPAFILSGFIFDIGSMPVALQMLTRVLPARYFVTILQTVFLAGDVWSIILPNSLALAGMAVLFLGLTRWQARKRLD